METLRHSQLSLTLNIYSQVLPALQHDPADGRRLRALVCRVSVSSATTPPFIETKQDDLFGESGDSPLGLAFRGAPRPDSTERDVILRGLRERVVAAIETHGQ